MLFKRSETLAKADVTDQELRRLEDEGLVAPVRSWRSLWLVPYYHGSQISAIQWLVSCQRTEDGFREQESRLVASEN